MDGIQHSNEAVPRKGRGNFRIRSVSRDPRWHVPEGRGTRHCEVPGCRTHTKGDKPRCAGHVDQMAYVDRLLKRIEDREETDAAVKKFGPSVASPEDLTAKEIIGFLRVYGPRTVTRLGRDINDKDLAKAYCQMLAVKGIINVSQNKRGTTVLELREEEK